MQQEIILGVEFSDVGLGTHELELREAGRQHLLHAIVDIAWPEGDHGFREIFLEQGQHPRGMGDISDIHRLPRGTQHHARGTLTFGGAHRSGDGGDKSGFKETATGEHCY